MAALKHYGLLGAAQEFHAGINGGAEAEGPARMLLPPKANRIFHGSQCRNECRTILAMEHWIAEHPGWYVLYLHPKGATHDAEFEGGMRDVWRRCMMKHLVGNWQKCVADLNSGFDSVGCHWMTGKQTPPGQSIWAGNFWWAKSDFLKTLPSITLRDRIKLSGLDSLESRYESEVWIGNGPNLPKIKDYHGPGWDPSKVSTCISQS